MKASDLINFLIDGQWKKGKSKQNKDGDKEKTDKWEIICYNCEKPGHKQFKCWAKGSGKEGQGPGQKKSAKAQKAIVAVTDNNKDKLFAFTCTSDYANRLCKHCRNSPSAEI